MKNKIVVVIAAYNEKNKINEVVNEVLKYADKVVVIDDGSGDKTGRVIKGKKKVVVLSHCVNLGQGAALQTGFDYVLRFLDPKVVITFDADGQFEAREIKRIIKPILDNKVDVVLGSRFLGKTINMSKLRYIFLKLGIIFTYLFSNIWLSDTHNGFRALSKNGLKKINLVQNRMTHASEFIDQIKRNNLSYIEMPVTVKYNSYSKAKGQNNLNSIKIVIDLIYANILAK